MVKEPSLIRNALVEKIKCPDGSWDITNGIIPPCYGQKSIPQVTDSAIIQPTKTTPQTLTTATEQPKKLSDKLLGKNDGFGVNRMGNLLMYVVGGGVLGFFASKPTKLPKTISTTLGVAVVVVFFAGLNTYENLKNEK